MIRISRLADYGIVILCHMAAQPAVPVSARHLSEQTRISESAIMKILKLLVKADIVTSIRGSKGGYLLKYPPRQINLLDVVGAIDGSVAVTQCTHPAHANTACQCEFETGCTAKSAFHRINQALQHTLSSFTLEDFMTQPPLSGKDLSKEFYVIAS